MAAKSTENAKVENGAQFTLPPIVGINFGNSYASIAVHTKVSNFFFQALFILIGCANDRKKTQSALPMKMENGK